MSTNVRFVPVNLAELASSLTATSSAGSLLPANMLIDERDAVWRSTSLAAQTLTFQWAAAQTVDSICLAWTNLTSGGTVQAKGYTNVGDGGTVFDETVAPDTALDVGNITVQNWIPAAHNIKQLKIVITDAGNPAGYVQVSRLCVGKRIEPVKNWTQKSLNLVWIKQRKGARAESFDFRGERGRQCRRMKFSLDYLEPASRDAFMAMVRNADGKGVWVSAFPESSDAGVRQECAFYGTFPDETEFGYPALNTWSAPVVLVEMG